MTQFSPFTTLRTLIHQAQRDGRLVPSPVAARKQFDTLILNEVGPILKHLASVLSQEGLSTEAFLELDHDPPYIELRIEESEAQLLCRPTADFRSLTLSFRLLREGGCYQMHDLPFHGFTGARLSFLLEEMLINVLLTPAPLI